MPHLNLDLDYFEHYKTKRLVGLLGRGAEVLPIKLWRYCGKFHCEDGRLTGYTEQEIESIVEWWGKPGECIGALLTVGFLEKDDVGYFVHDWLEVQGHIKALKERNSKNAKSRWDKIRGQCQTDATGMRGQCPLPSKPSKPSIKTPIPPAGAAGSGGEDPQSHAAGFAEFWASYPRHSRKQGKSKCLEHWRRKRLFEHRDRILAALEACKADWRKENDRFVPYPMTWFGRTPWESDPADLAATESTANRDSPGFERAEVTEDILRIAFGDGGEK